MTLTAASAPPRANSSAAHDAQAVIASVSDQEFCVTRTYGVFRIPACAQNDPCSLLVVDSREDALHFAENHSFPFRISARDIAFDVIQDLEPHGIFVCAAELPSDDELSAARARRDAWFRQLVAEADEMWARGHSYREISDMHRRAAHHLGIEREWAYVPQLAADCPACGEKVKAGVVACRHCGALLDAERAAKYFPNSAPREKFAPRHASAQSAPAQTRP